MSTYVLSGQGVQTLSANVTALHVTITTLPPGYGSGTANPLNYFHVAMLRFGDGTGYWLALPVTGGPQWFGVPVGTTQLGYAVQPSGVITVVEVIGGSSPFGGAIPTLEQLTDVTVSSIADGQLLEWSASLSKWINVTPAAPPTAGPLILLSSTILSTSAASIDFASIPNTSKHLWVQYLLRGDLVDTANFVRLRFNGDSAAHYVWGSTNQNTNQQTSGDHVSIGLASYASATSGYFAVGSFWVPFYAQTAEFKGASGLSFAAISTSANYSAVNGGLWLSTAAINELTLLPQSGNFIAGSSVDLYGM